uniref:BAG cochaperone 4 n=1 Tax=Cairina moschata TaxID=8855 RepID=A0A8C3C7W2_CAIMO
AAVMEPRGSAAPWAPGPPAGQVRGGRGRDRGGGARRGPGGGSGGSRGGVRGNPGGSGGGRGGSSRAEGSPPLLPGARWWLGTAPASRRLPPPVPVPPPQGMDSPYSTGAYSAPYPPAAPHYPGLPQPRGFGSSGPPRSPYPTEPPARYRPPAPAAPWGYGTADSLEGASLRRQVTPVPPFLLQTPGMPVPQYPYGDGHLGATPQGPQSRPQEEAWAPPAAYGAQPRNAWSPFGTDPHPAWDGGSGAASYPPCFPPNLPLSPSPAGFCIEAKVVYQISSLCIKIRGCNSRKPHRQQVSGGKELKWGSSQLTVSEVQYSAQPQMYGAAPRKLLAGKQEGGLRGGEQAAGNAAAMQPEIQRILHITRAAVQLEQEVDEFVGKKTDKSYRLLEEMLTKLLLELDSIETGGQDGVRQARKEAVHRIQAILEILERKGL